jgi:ParB-like chromosome segregation protein Spo0J
MLLPQMQSMRVLRSEIVVDPSINSRLSYNEGDESDRAKSYNREIKRLADDIKTKGVLQPPVLMRLSQAGDAYKKAAKEGGQYLLIVGFRRQGALDLLGQSEATYSIAPPTWGMKDAQAANAAENLAREDLTPYEVAMWCLRMNDVENLSAAEIAKLVRAQDTDPQGKSTLSEAHVGNMIRCARELHPDILAAWEAGHKLASMRTLIGLAAEKDPAAQLAAWETLTTPKGKEEKGEGGSAKGGNAQPPRPSAAKMAVMIEAIKKSDKEADWKKGATQALLWAAGVKPAIPGIDYDAFTEQQKADAAAANDVDKAKKKKGGAEGKAEGADASGAAPNGS